MRELIREPGKGIVTGGDAVLVVPIVLHGALGAGGRFALS